MVLAAALLAAMCVASLAIGTENVTLQTVWHALTDYRDIGDQWIVRDLRIPRTVLAVIVGLALGLSGTLIQAVSRNRWPTPRSSGSTPVQRCSLSERSHSSA